jgi:hypothetical protein
MSNALVFRINTPHVASEIIEGEVVMIHFATGCYYSTDKVGAVILALVQRQASVAEIVNRLSAACAGEPKRMEESIHGFLDQARREGLIVPVEGPLAAPAADQWPAPGEKTPFEAPRLNKYTDLQDLLILDPIHDTDGAGWPVLNPQTTPSGV